MQDAKGKKNLFQTFPMRRISLRFQIRRVFENWFHIHNARVVLGKRPSFSQHSHINTQCPLVPRWFFCWGTFSRTFRGENFVKKMMKKKKKTFPRATSSSSIQIRRVCRDWWSIDWGRVFCPPVTRHTLASKFVKSQKKCHFFSKIWKNSDHWFLRKIPI